ncbi:MAG: 50S ribosomal protein L18e [Candidatus Aenigmarchaeota archaeon]|nr:50S ribosomal protein L18e [Candidatus Aenigmarchaeota archaeon]
MKKTKSINPEIRELIEILKERDEKIWKDLAVRISKSKRNRPTVNLSSINRHAKSGEIIIVPGKVLSYGKLDKKITIGALSFSEESKKKIKNSKSDFKKIKELVKEKPNKIRIFG